MSFTHPVLFNGEMVRAIVEGRKTQTRRPVRNQEAIGVDLLGPLEFNRLCSLHFSRGLERSPVGFPAGRLYVRETWCRHFSDAVRDTLSVGYRANADSDEFAAWAERKGDGSVLWRPSIHMPRSASRIWLKVERVWVERAQDITEADALAEGPVPNWTGPLNAGVGGPFDPDVHGYLTAWGKKCAERGDDSGPGEGYVFTAREWFQDTWEAIYGSWDDNPWVWACEFSVLSTSGEPS